VLTAVNENEAMKALGERISAVIADIDLSEAGGSEDGGIRLAEQLAERGIRMPIILFSYAPGDHLPPWTARNTERHSQLGIHAFLDRNSDTFLDDLVEQLKALESLSPRRPT